MNHFLRTAAIAAAIAGSALAGNAQAAASIFESASFVDESVSGGDFYIDSTRYLGAIFSVTTTEQLTAIGGNFSLYGDGGDVFGAIVPLALDGTLPLDVNSAAVAHTVFTPVGGDQTAAIDGVLTPGTYAVVFGSGLYGTTGYSGLVSGQVALGSPSFVQYGGASITPSAFVDDTLRAVVQAQPVPEPAGLVLAAGGALMLLLARRRHAQ